MIALASDHTGIEMKKEIMKMLDEMGFELNEKKTCFVTNHSRLSVTGLTVNSTLSVAKDYKRKLRQELYFGFKYGFEGAVSRTKHPEFFDENNHFHPVFQNIPSHCHPNTCENEQFPFHHLVS